MNKKLVISMIFGAIMILNPIKAETGHWYEPLSSFYESVKQTTSDWIESIKQALRPTEKVETAVTPVQSEVTVQESADMPSDLQETEASVEVESLDSEPLGTELVDVTEPSESSSEPLEFSEEIAEVTIEPGQTEEISVENPVQDLETGDTLQELPTQTESISEDFEPSTTVIESTDIEEPLVSVSEGELSVSDTEQPALEPSLEQELVELDQLESAAEVMPSAEVSTTDVLDIVE